MAHEITEANGRYEFAYTGQAPWHNLGQQLPEAATSLDIMRAAGLEWVVAAEPIYLQDGAKVPGFVANRRLDTKEVLGIVSNDYRVVQNGDALTFVDSLVGEAAAMYHTAGSIRGGKKVFATAKLPQSTVVLPGDVVDHYLLIVNAHDGSSALHVRFTPVRVVCANTLGAAIRGATKWQHTVAHIGDLSKHLNEARTALGVAMRYFEIAGEKYKALAAKDISSLELISFLDGFLPIPSDDTASRVTRSRAAVTELFESGLGTDIPGVRGTAWGAMNAGIEWVERVRTARKDGDPRKGSAEAAIFGHTAAEYRERAISSALALISRGETK